MLLLKDIRTSTIRFAFIPRYIENASKAAERNGAANVFIEHSLKYLLLIVLFLDFHLL